jgi:hypothetical protein
MKRQALSFKMALCVLLGIFFFSPPEESFGYPVGSNGWHLNSPFQAKHNADLVCKVRVLSIRREEVLKYGPSTLIPNISRMIATSKVLSVIKGKCPQVIDIEFLYPEERNRDFGDLLCQIYTELSENEVCIVFLKQAKPYYRLNRIMSKARVQPEIVDYNLGDTTNLRLLAEFLAGCKSDNEMVKLQAAEELGYLGDVMIGRLRQFKDDKEMFQRLVFGLVKAKEALRKTRSSENIVIRAASIISSFQVDDSPGIEGPLKLLRISSSYFTPDDSLNKYGIRDFCVSGLQLRLLETMDSTTRRAVFDLKDGSKIRREEGSPYIFRGVRGFDYAEFFKQALDCESVKKDTQMRSHIANVIWIRYEKGSVPDMIRQLDDSNIYIRGTAVSALRKCINSDFSNSWESRHFYDLRAAEEYMRKGIEKPLEERQKDYQDNEQEYIQYWKKWWQERKSEFETPEKTNNGAD